jgi:uncharacterized membrane protein
VPAIRRSRRTVAARGDLRHALSFPPSLSVIAMAQPAAIFSLCHSRLDRESIPDDEQQRNIIRENQRRTSMTEKISERFDDVTVICKANIFFEGKVVSHTVLFKDGLHIHEHSYFTCCEP